MGHKRFALPCSTFLMHDGRNLVWDSGSEAQGKMDFDKRFELEVVKKHILEHSNMLLSKELEMIKDDALRHSDEIRALILHP